MMDTRTHWPLIALLWTTGLLAAAQFAKLSLTLDAVQVQFGGMPVAYLVSAVSIVGIVCGALSGFFVAKIGARRAVLWAIALSAVVSLVQAIAMPFWAFMATRVIEGFGHLLLVVALPTMMAGLAKPSDKSVVMGIWGTFFGVGFALLSLVVPYLLSVGGPQLVFGLHGVVLALIWPVLWRALPRLVAGNAPMPNFIALHRAMFSDPRFYAPSLGHGSYTSIFIALVAFLPAALGAPWLTPLVALANLSGTLASGFIARLIPASKLSVLSFAIAGALFVVMGLTGSIIVAMCALFSTGVCAGANFGAVPEFNASAEDQARANGAMAQIGNMGTFAGTPIYALVAGSLWGIAGVSVVICIIGVVIAGWAYARARRGNVSSLAA